MVKEINGDSVIQDDMEVLAKQARDLQDKGLELWIKSVGIKKERLNGELEQVERLLFLLGREKRRRERGKGEAKGWSGVQKGFAGKGELCKQDGE